MFTNNLNVNVTNGKCRNTGHDVFVIVARTDLGAAQTIIAHTQEDAAEAFLTLLGGVPERFKLSNVA